MTQGNSVETYQKWLTKSSTQIQRYNNTETAVKRIIEDKPPTVLSLKKYDHRKCLTKLSEFIQDACEGFDGGISTQKAVMVANEVVNTYPLNQVTIPDIYVCMKQVRSQKHFGKIDSNKILYYLNEYMEERIKIAASYNRTQHHNKTTGKISKVTEDQIRKMYQEFDESKIETAEKPKRSDQKTLEIARFIKSKWDKLPDKQKQSTNYDEFFTKELKHLNHE